MWPKGTRRSALCQTLCVLAIALAPTLARGSTEGTATEGGPRYNGGFWGLQLHLGVTSRVDADLGEGIGPVLGVSGRIATLMSLVDVQVGVRAGTYDGPEGASVSRWSATAELHAHPMFLRHLYGSNRWYWLAGLHVSFGAGLEVVGVTAPGIDETLPGFGWQIGAGTDIPVGEVDDGWGLWLGVDYTLKFLAVHSAAPRLDDFDEHVLVFTLAYRNNDIGFAQVPRPPELDDREPLRR